LAGGLLWMAWDGIQGYLKKDEWGVSGIAAALGGAFGGTGVGAENAYRNAAKGGLVGGGIGMMVGGPLGLVAGALIGAAVFGIMGYIGGERLAKELDEVGKKLSKWYEEDLKPTVDGWKIWAKETFLPQVTQLWGSLKELGPALALMTKWTVEFVGTVGKFVLSETVKDLNKLAVDIKALGEWLGVAAEKLSNADFWRKKVDDSLDGLKKSVWNFGDWLDDMSDSVNEAVGSQKRSPLKTFDELTKEYTQAEQNNDQRAMNHVQRQLDQVKKQMDEQTTLLVTPLQELEEQLVKQNKLLFPDPLRIIELERKIKEKKKLEPELGSAETFKGIDKKNLDFLKSVTTIPTKFNWFPNNKEPIRFQSAKDDKEYRMDSGTLNIQPDDILGKTFANIDKQFKALNTLTQKSMDKLDEHAEIFKKLLQVNQQQLNILPSLAASEPASNEREFSNSGQISKIDDYRKDIREYSWRRK